MSRFIALLSVLLFVAGARAEGVTVAVAANFAVTLAELQAVFARETGVRLRVVKGATGQLASQIVHGAPFDVFLAADQAAPELLEKRGLVVAGSRFTYAVGRLALWQPAAEARFDGEALLKSGRIRHLAIANPAVAPYGRAALQVLSSLGHSESAGFKLVRGGNVAQAYGLVATGNAEAGFVALSQLVAAARRGHYWTVPEMLHVPIRQDAVLLDRARAIVAASRFLAFLKTDAARALIRDAGYGDVPSGS